MGWYLASGSAEGLVHGFRRDPSGVITTIDLPGHGRSTDMLATDLIDTALMVGDTGGQGSYIGYSLGARVSLTLACVRPELVDRLVTSALRRATR